MCIADDAYIKHEEKTQLSPLFSFSSISSHEQSVNSSNMAVMYTDRESRRCPTHFQNVITTLPDVRRVNVFYIPLQTAAVSR